MTAIGSALRFEASNGLTVAISDVPDLVGIEEIGAILPSPTVAIIARLTEGREGDVVLSVSSSRVSLQMGDIVLSSKLIDGSYPDIQRAIPKNTPNTLTVDADALAEAVKRVSGASDDKIPSVSLSITAAAIAIMSRGSDGEEGTDEIECEYDGPEIAFKLTTEYVLSAIASINEDQVVANIGGPRDGQIWRGVASDRTMCLLMPRLA